MPPQQRLGRDHERAPRIPRERPARRGEERPVTVLQLRAPDGPAEDLHLVAEDGQRLVQGWVGLRGSLQLPLGGHPVMVEYRPEIRELPFSVGLLDFRKIDYPGTSMAAAFESDVEVSDPERGVAMKRKISMNNPLKYRGYSLFQSSYVQGETEATVLSVRKDPGTPLVYAGFLIIVLGVVSMFVFRREP
ncbi:MAG: cytochrome c biogenesis protein ResB [Candidatus Omnitrophica bacterium]|nr:cytochrome c biogenesis protein ResB [Candidatus Omnitrophota bacterium]